MLLVALAIAVVLPAWASPRATHRFTDDLRAYDARRPIEGVWHVEGGTPRVRDGWLRLEAPRNATALPHRVPAAPVLALVAAMRWERRLAAAGWSAAGIAVVADDANFWRLTLVEGPDGRRYVELVQMLEGVWQAQSAPGTRLDRLPNEVDLGPWEPGREYSLRISLEGGAVVGEVRKPGPRGRLLYRAGFSLEGGARAVRSGRPALAAAAAEASFRRIAAVARVADGAVPRAAGPYRVAVHGTPASAAPWVRALRSRGIDAGAVSTAGIGRADRLSASRWDALLLPDASACPIDARDNLLRFLRDGGDLIAVGGPLFDRSIRAARERFRAEVDRATAQRLLLPLSTARAPALARGARNFNDPARWRVERTGPPGAADALRVDLGAFDGWDTLTAQATGAFAPGDDVLLFWARGDARTRHLVVELQESDGSRWLTTVPLGSRWRRYALASRDFAFWSDSPSQGRGGRGDRLRPENAASFSFGLATSHAPEPPGPKTYWIAGVSAGRTARPVRLGDLETPELETLSPSYKVYHLPSLRPRQAELERLAATGHRTGPVVTPIARPRGLAFEAARAGRWIPLEPILDEHGIPRGTRRSIYLNLRPPYRGAVFAHLAGTKRAGSAPVEAAALAERLARGLFFTRAGSGQFAYWPGEAIPLGAQVMAVGLRGARVEVDLRVVAPGGATAHRVRERVDVPAGGLRNVTAVWRPRRLPPGDWRTIAVLRADGREIDRIEQRWTALDPTPAPREAFVRVRDGQFVVREPERPGRWDRLGPERPWYPFGVNYWMTSVAGTSPVDYGMHWLNVTRYDPDVVEGDLATIAALGMNHVSIAGGDVDTVRQVNDFVARAARRGIRVLVFLIGAHPFHADETVFRPILEQGRFAGNPAIWSWDIAWEHRLGPHEERRGWDREWEEWVIERYGSIARAEAAWGVPIPRGPDGRVTNPPDYQLRQDGPWLRLANAYSRAADDVISRRYGDVIRRIRAIDPNHLISARSASQPSWTSWFAYDLNSCGKHFDYSSPEGYGLQPHESGFTTAYARYAGTGKPVFWAEVGASIYPWDSTGEKARNQAALHRGFAQMLLDSGANGLAAWWSVGGYRTDERSDFGILAPDRTPRPAARELQRLARAVTTPRSTRPPDRWVTVDRDLHAAAYQAVYDTHKSAYVEAVRAGGMVGVRTGGTGTTSADTPLTAVGNLPYDGFAPLKFLNAEFDSLEVQDAGGAWRPAGRGAEIAVARGQPVRARARVGNTGDAIWLARAPVGAVRLVGDERADAASTGMPRLVFAAPLTGDVARHADAHFGEFVVASGLESDAEAVFTLEAEGRARFGERRRVILRVR